MKRFLWLEDNVDLMRESLEIFKDYGFLFHPCPSPSRALKILRKGIYHNLLLDIDFPHNRKEGLDFLEEIKDLVPNLNIVIFTGYPEYEDAVQTAKKNLIANYIPKPIPLSEIEKKKFFNALDKAFTIERKINISNRKKKIEKLSGGSPPKEKWQIVAIIVAIILFILGIIFK